MENTKTKLWLKTLLFVFGSSSLKYIFRLYDQDGNFEKAKATLQNHQVQDQ